MVWKSPIPLALVADADPDGYRIHGPDRTGLPIGHLHPGAFGFRRKNHIHEGVDLYCPEGTVVTAVEGGEVVAVIRFTGPSAEPPSPWWHDTDAVLVEGRSGVVVYGEIEADVRVGDLLEACDPVGRVKTVLRSRKHGDRPISMLHLELAIPGTRDAYEWTDATGRPETLVDPTPFLLGAIGAEANPIEDTRAYAMIREFYGDRIAARSRVPLIAHIIEGIEILRRIGADRRTMEAYAIHPLFQADADLTANRETAALLDPQVVLLAMEYRSVANDFLSDQVETGPDAWGAVGCHPRKPIRMSPLPEVTEMLVADKVQNRKDFLAHHKGSHARSDELDAYFDLWLKRLGIDEACYGRLTAGLSAS